VADSITWNNFNKFCDFSIPIQTTRGCVKFGKAPKFVMLIENLRRFLISFFKLSCKVGISVYFKLPRNFKVRCWFFLLTHLIICRVFLEIFCLTALSLLIISCEKSIAKKLLVVSMGYQFINKESYLLFYQRYMFTCTRFLIHGIRELPCCVCDVA